MLNYVFAEAGEQSVLWRSKVWDSGLCLLYFQFRLGDRVLYIVVGLLWEYGLSALFVIWSLCSLALNV